jgi:para-nitrobenzyl esterase
MPALTLRLPALTLLGLALAIPAAHADPLKVKTAQGQVEGTLTADAKVRVFKGIPYAAPPVGDLRWREPQPPAKFHGTFKARDYGHRCVQTNQFEDMIFHDSGPSEDCLTLNVWAPADGKKLPVMLWIYGGGYTAGSTSEARQDGQFLAHKGVIVVTLNYRLGIFGFFVHPALTAESPHHASGNYGLLDQAAGLAWVKKNIVAFGGDPDNITLFGESAGSFSVSTLMASPVTRGSVAKAIGESGAAFSSSGLSFPSREESEQKDAAFAKAAWGTDDLAALRKLTVEQLLAGVNNKTIQPGPRFAPDVDGYLLPKPVPEIYAAGEQAHIPLMAGWNHDEGLAAVAYAKVKPTPQSFAADAQKQYGDDAPAFLAAYGAKTDAEAERATADLAGDRFIAFSTWKWLEAQVKTGAARVYRYRLDLKPTGSKYHPVETGAFHSDDIEYVFGTLDSRDGATWRPEDRKLSNEMMDYWTNFAKSGNPNLPNARNEIDLPTWPEYKPTAYEVMHLDNPPEARPDEHRDRYLFLEAHPDKPRE